MRKRHIFMLAVGVTLTRLPFLNAGHGNDPDAWQLANAARELAASGRYVASRLPGYPLVELSYAQLYRFGLEDPFLFNGLTAVLSGLACLFFCLLLRHAGRSQVLLSGLTLAFTPVFFIHSTNSMDYMWGLAFLLGATYFTLDEKPLLAGLLLGLASGGRVTSAVMLLPLLILLWQRQPQRIWRSGLQLSLTAVGVALLSFAPVFQAYGWGFLTSYGNPPPLLWLVYSGSVGVWGAVGALALVGLVGVELVAEWERPFIGRWQDGVRAARQETLMPTALLAIALYAGAFLLLPHDGAYLLPAVPFTLFVLQRWLQPTRYQLLCILVIGSAFILTVERDKVQLAGPIFNDYQERVEKTIFVERYLTEIARLDQPSLIVAGPWQPQLLATAPADLNPLVDIVFLIPPDALQAYIAAEVQIYTLSGQRELTADYYGYDLTALGAVPLVPDEPPGVKW